VSMGKREGTGLGTHWRIVSGRHAQRSRVAGGERVGGVVVDDEDILNERGNWLQRNEEWSVNQELTKTVTKGHKESEPPADRRSAQATCQSFARRLQVVCKSSTQVVCSSRHIWCDLLWCDLFRARLSSLLTAPITLLPRWSSSSPAAEGLHACM
jgi:hypothetical protein